MTIATAGHAGSDGQRSCQVVMNHLRHAEPGKYVDADSRTATLRGSVVEAATPQ